MKAKNEDRRRRKDCFFASSVDLCHVTAVLLWSQRAPWKGKRATSRLRVKLRLRATHLVASASRLYLSLSSFSADFCQIFEGLSKQWRGGNSIWINDQSGKPEFGWSSTCVSRWCLLTHGRNPAVAHLRHPPLSHLHLVCLFFRVSGPLQTPRTYSRLTRITPPTGTVRRPYSQSACSRMRETTHLESARLACLPVLDGDLAFALEFALEIPVVLVLPVDRSPEIRNWSEEGGRRALVMCYLKKALQEKQQWPP